MPAAKPRTDQDSLSARTLSYLEALMLRHRLLINIVIHNVLFTGGLLLAFTIWLDAGGRGKGQNWFLEGFLPILPFVLLVKTALFWALNLFRGWWQYASIRDVARIVLAAWLFLLISFAVVTATVYVPKWLGSEALIDYQPGILMLDFINTVFLICTARLGIRLYREELRPVSAEGVRRVMIVGAGNAAETLIREIHRMREERYRVIGLVDDDPTLQGLYIHGLPVMGQVADLKTLCEENDIDEILIALPSATQKELRRVIGFCRGTNLKFQQVPGVSDLIDGRFTVSQIREVDINDLLGREVVNLDRAALAHFLRSRRVLVTGAGGSIGSEMCRQICAFEPAKLILLEQAENPLFEIERELSQRWPDIEVSAVVCDIFDRERVDTIFREHRPEVVIHAAAHKHVPLMERNPCEAVKNNIFGTRNVADACCKHEVGEFVLISTDKAVNPSSVMGCTKRVAELYIQNLNNRPGCVTQFKAVRFGNVLGSAGSVVPIFKKQIAEGGPVRVTHPEMTRYFMTIPEASQLVLQAAATGKGGQVFLLDMGEPVKIVDLARDLITLSGFRPDEDIEILFTGVRPGEKLFEELRTEGEDIAPTTHEKIRVWRTVPIDGEVLQAGLDGLAELVNSPQRASIIRALQSLVPEYRPLNPPEEIDAQQVRRTDRRSGFLSQARVKF